jgi:drug/metabolite transporter (DMT)-like permease
MDDQIRRRTFVAGILESIPPALVGFSWMLAAGLLFGVLNALQKLLSHELYPPQVACLRYLVGSVVLLPLVMRAGWIVYRPRNVRLQLLRGGVHGVGCILWFAALPFVTLAQNAAIGFTGPIFMMLGAWLFLAERMYPSRWVAVLVAFLGVVVVLWPDLIRVDLGSVYTLLLLCAAAVFATSFLISKRLTRYDAPEAIVFWLGIMVSFLTLPFALVGVRWSSAGPTLYQAWQWPTATQWLLFLGAGIFGSAAHYCMTRAFHAGDVSAVQPARFFDLIWASLFGFIVFGHLPTVWALIGGSIICSATLWIARRERARPLLSA